MNFTDPGREKAHRKMEKKLTDLQRFWRKFASGRPPADLRLDPVNGLALACNLRDRLEQTIGEFRLTSLGIAFTVPNAPKEQPGGFLSLKRGKENEPLESMLRFKGARVLAVMIWLLDPDKNEKRVFVYQLDRSGEGIAITDWLWKRQLSGEARSSTN